MDAIRILIVDDEKVIRDGVERALAGKDYVITKAESGERGIEMIRTAGCDILLLDLMMPGMAGIESIHAVREAYPDLRYTPGVIVGRSDPSKRIEIERIPGLRMAGVVVGVGYRLGSVDA